MNAQPTHHVPDSLLISYVAGTSDDATALAVACHLTLCGRCQGLAAALEGLAGEELESAPVEDAQVPGLETVLGRLEEPEPAPPETPPADGLLPLPLLRRLGGPPRWRWLVPGIRGVDVPVAAGASAVRLVRLAPRMKIPLHDHAGAEYTVVFSGGIEDATGRFHRGDVCIQQSGQQHTQHVLPGETCLALVVNMGELVPLTFTGRLAKLIAGA